MKPQNQISLKILTLALLLIASCEVWAVNFGQSQPNPLLIQTQITDTRDNQNIVDQDLMFKPAFSNLFTNDILADPIKGKVFYLKKEDNNNHFCMQIFVLVADETHLSLKKQNDNLKSSERLSKLDSNISDVKLNFYTDNLIANNIISYGLCGFGSYASPPCGLGSRTLDTFEALVPEKYDIFFTNGKGGGSWSNSNTWLDGNVPKNNVSIFVSEGDVLILDSNVTIQTLYLERNSKVTADKNPRILEITKDIDVDDSASIISNFGSGKLDCYITAANDGKSLISIAQTAKVNFENLKILGETFFEKGNMDVMNFSAIKQKDFIIQTGTVLNIGQTK